MIKTCSKCGLDKELETEFCKCTQHANGYKAHCKACSNIYRAKRHANNPIPVMLNAAKHRAIRDNVSFTLKPSDITVPELCPILRIPLAVHAGKGGAPNSPSLDKITPELGYVPGNVQVISSLANVMKSNASLEQMVNLGKWAAKQLKDQTRAIG